MLGYLNSGFSVDAGVCIQAHDRAALVRLLCYCARTPFAMNVFAKRARPWCHCHARTGIVTLACWPRTPRTELR